MMRYLTAGCLAGLLGACAAPPPDVACYVKNTTFLGNPGSQGNPPMEMFTRTDARWCGFSMRAVADNKHSARAAITEKPEHGTAVAIVLKGVARAEYRPDAGFVGVDYFTAGFLHPDYDVRVRVVVRPAVP